jgi:thymidylate synthase
LRLLLICSQPKNSALRPGAFQKVFDSAWADRFLMHLRRIRDLCTGCGEECVHCRDWRVHDHDADIAGIIRLPSILPELLDDPHEFLCAELPPHDVLVAIEIHEEVLLELPRMSAQVGGKAMIVPIEAPEWVSRWAAGKMREAGRKAGIEIALPKPFCSLSPGSGPTLDAFIEHFHIGYPQIKIEALEGRAFKLIARTSAPCGNSHFVAHSLQGYPLNEALQFEVCRYWHSYPCTASMKTDAELGDTILHKGGQIHMEAFCTAAGMPFGKVVGCTPTVKI